MESAETRLEVATESLASLEARRREIDAELGSHVEYISTHQLALQRQRKDALRIERHRTGEAIAEAEALVYRLRREVGYVRFAKHGGAFLARAESMLALLDQVIAANAELVAERAVSLCDLSEVDEVPRLVFPVGADGREMQNLRSLYAERLEAARELIARHATEEAHA